MSSVTALGTLIKGPSRTMIITDYFCTHIVPDPVFNLAGTPFIVLT